MTLLLLKVYIVMHFIHQRKQIAARWMLVMGLAREYHVVYKTVTTYYQRKQTKLSTKAMVNRLPGRTNRNKWNRVKRNAPIRWWREVSHSPEAKGTRPDFCRQRPHDLEEEDFLLQKVIHHPLSLTYKFIRNLIIFCPFDKLAFQHLVPRKEGLSLILLQLLCCLVLGTGPWSLME